MLKDLGSLHSRFAPFRRDKACRTGGETPTGLRPEGAVAMEEVQSKKAGACNIAEHQALAREVKALKLAAWRAKQAEMAAALERPSSPYRLARMTESGAWQVQRWRIRLSNPTVDYEAYRRSSGYGLRMSFDGLGNEYPDFSVDPAVSLEWDRFGPHESFDTFENAEAWLQGWIKPIGDFVYYAEDGAPA